jgi:ATP-dependent DNA helicase PIF1
MSLDSSFRRIILPSPEEGESVTSLITPAPAPIKPFSIPVSSPMESDRERLIDALRSGVPVVLLHGRAGTGKTSLILSLRNEGLRHVVVAPTGIAALNAGGQTIHKFFGIPPRIVNLDDIKPRHRLGSILRKIDLVVIDEVSMVRADLLDVVDRTLRVHLDPDKPFGGKTILLAGDFLQLPPVVEEHDVPILLDRGYDVTYAFGAKCIQDLRNLALIELSTVYRQSDPEFLDLLHNVRTGEKLEDTVRCLNLRCYRQHRSTAKPIILTSRTDAALEYNRQGLAALPGDAIRFNGTMEGDFRIFRDRLPAPEHLDLKKDARIMMVKNDPEKRWVNGSLGTVSNLSPAAVWVRLDEFANEEEVHKATWESIEYQYDALTQRVNPVVVGTYTQFPIVPAWAMTIHKAQGLTLDDVRIDLGQGAFSAGQAYVALSRARSLEGLSFGKPLRISDVMADAKLVESVRHIAASGKAIS